MATDLRSTSAYKEAIENMASYNSKLKTERIGRLPFVDTQTGVIQNHSNLWKSEQDRYLGVYPFQLFSYPAKRWKKRPRPVSEPLEFQKNVDGNGEIQEASEGYCLRRHHDEASSTVIDESTNQDFDSTWLDDDEYMKDAGEIESDYDSDYEESYTKKRRRKPAKKAPQRKALTTVVYDGDGEKHFICEVCSADYRSRTGLQYHMVKVHPHEVDLHGERPSPRLAEDDTDPDGLRASPAATVAGGVQQHAGGGAGHPGQQRPRPVSSKLCDFCLGDVDLNKKTGLPEELVSCADCGRSGHPSCLQFTPNMMVSVKQYPWQCIECKACALCGTSDNDEQLLFCDDCDRGYHMYCLNPPLTEPPEGNWSCHLCIAEFHTNR